MQSVMSLTNMMQLVGSKFSIQPRPGVIVVIPLSST